ncbi:XamI family restriction endonuclease [Agreia sp. COWG]|uniref:XamI family restriction endonuclease n=1 Tax=Agreia sp. COWG TaxID=2773266 RepID=UPI001AF9E24C|nr:XamI family restriction endonuclease [Agreia sp. COWG]CAD6015883.1 Type-2 restriction enzyme XamI [Agreia sp. COWG]
MTNRPTWSEDQLRAGSRTAIDIFREERLIEPLEKYLEIFDDYRAAVENLIEGTVDLSQLSAQAVEYVANEKSLVAVRYLASPFISEDDLKVLADASLAPSVLRRNPEMAGRVVEAVMTALDRRRFPWIGEDREPTQEERESAILSTTSIIATSRAQTARRSTSKDEQEEAVKARLRAEGFVEVPTRPIPNSASAPEPGQFCAETSFGTRKADVVIRLWDGRTLPLECKVSNSSTNSVKRLNNDAAIKAKTWLQEFGANNVVPAAMLSGVFKVHNLVSAQADGLSLFWAHDLDSFVDFIDSTLT